MGTLLNASLRQTKLKGRGRKIIFQLSFLCLFLGQQSTSLLLPPVLPITSVPNSNNDNDSRSPSGESRGSRSAEYLHRCLHPGDEASDWSAALWKAGRFCAAPGLRDRGVSRRGRDAPYSRPEVGSGAQLLPQRREGALVFSCWQELHCTRCVSLPASLLVFASRLGSHEQALY